MAAAARYLLLALLAATLAASEETTTSENSTSAEGGLRLPLEAVPRRYRLDIVPRLEGDFSFLGVVQVDLLAARAARRITLHVGRGLEVELGAAELHLLLPGATGAAGEVERRVAVAGAEEADAEDRAAILLSEALLPGRRYRLRLRFNSTLADDLTGFYRASFKDGNATRWLASTVFEPTEARRAFPCFDEPALKARFQINVARAPEHTALSNMPLNATEPMEDGPEGWVWDRFEESPPMSTYLAAWAVGPLASREAEGPDGRRFRVWARPAALSDADYPLRLAPRMHRFLSDLLGIEDPVPKTDMLALPSFVSDALENWGLISFGERYLLPTAGSASGESRVGAILGHELAHAWFGNAVSPAWWDAIWLNEGFATYFGTLALHAVRPELQLMDTTAVRAFLEVFSTDALRSSHALTAAAAHKSDLYQIFDSITYYKGYYMLRMLNQSLGEDTLLRGLRRYVRRHRLGAATEDNLWTALSVEARAAGRPLPSDADVRALFRPWTHNPGFPLLTLERDYATGALRVAQERFLRAPGDTGSRSSEGGGGWWVPLTLARRGGPLLTETYAWLDPASANTTLTGADLPGPDDWLLANVQAAGLYRVNYDSRNWALLAAALRRDPASLPPLNRALLLDDALDLARAGRLPYATALDVASFLRGERALEPWMAATGDLDYLRRMLPRNTPQGRLLQRFLLRLVSPRFAELGLEARGPPGQEPPSDALARRLLAKWACALEDRECVRAALGQFERWREDSEANPLPADVRGAVLCTAVEHGQRGAWDFLWSRFANATTSAERAGVLAALGCSRDPAALGRLLDLSIQKGSPIRKQQSAAVFEAVAKNPVGHPVAKKFLFSNIERIREHVGNSPFHIPALVQALAYRMRTEEEIGELERLQAEHSESLRAASRTLQQAREAARFNAEWLRQHGDDISAWLLRAAPADAHADDGDADADDADVNADSDADAGDATLPAVDAA